MPCHNTANLRLIQFKYNHLLRHLHFVNLVQKMTFLRVADMKISLYRPSSRLRQRRKSATHIKIVFVTPNTVKLATHTKKKNAALSTNRSATQGISTSVRPSTGLN